jgi:purine-binding chemotaxis protein CheW
MKNVIVVALGQGQDRSRYAIELRWVREVFTLGHLTPVPRAPVPIAGVVNLRGSIMPVVDLESLLGEGRAPRANRGDGAVLVQVEELRAALRVDNVDEVTTLRAREDRLVDGAGREIALLDPPALLERAMAAVRRTEAGETAA